MTEKISSELSKEECLKKMQIECLTTSDFDLELRNLSAAQYQEMVYKLMEAKMLSEEQQAALRKLGYRTSQEP